MARRGRRTRRARAGRCPDRSSTSPSGSSSRRPPSACLAAATVAACVCASIRPGSTNAPPTSIRRPPCAGRSPRPARWTTPRSKTIVAPSVIVPRAGSSSRAPVSVSGGASRRGPCPSPRSRRGSPRRGLRRPRRAQRRRARRGRTRRQRLTPGEPTIRLACRPPRWSCERDVTSGRRSCPRRPRPQAGSRTWSRRPAGSPCASLAVVNVRSAGVGRTCSTRRAREVVPQLQARDLAAEVLHDPERAAAQDDPVGVGQPHAAEVDLGDPTCAQIDPPQLPRRALGRQQRVLGPRSDRRSHAYAGQRCVTKHATVLVAAARCSRSCRTRARRRSAGSASARGSPRWSRAPTAHGSPPNGPTARR